MGAAAGGAAAVAGLLASVRTYGKLDPWWVWAPVQVAGVSFIVAGLIARLRMPDNGIGWLMTATGITCYTADLRYSMQPAVFAAGFMLFYLSPVICTHLVLALPGGRLPAPPERWVALGLYLTILVTQPMRYFTEHPRPPQSWTTRVTTFSAWAPAGSVLGLALTLAAIWLVIKRWRAAGRPARRLHAAVWITGAMTGLIVLASTAASILNASAHILRPLELAYALAFIFIPVTILLGVLRAGIARMRVADLVVRLDATPEPRALHRALADALGDPALQVCFRLPGTGDYVDSGGQPVLLPAPGDRVVTPVTRRGKVLAALVHDPTLADQRPLVEAVVAAARLALENAQLYAAQRAQLEAVRASRARIVMAADLERQRIQRDLHDGVQNKLLTISLLVSQAAADAPAPALLDRAAAHLREVIAELRGLTEGIHPPSLTGQGLAAVVETLAERAPIPVQFTVPGLRWPDHVERTAYFVINESLANVYKHAAATQATVVITATDHTLAVDITDDGRGGADPEGGTGLRGLEDRVAAIGGTMRVSDRSPRGTHVRAELPCG
jgi:signal transduction histidine kinase